MSAIKRYIEDRMESLTDELKQAEKEYYATLNLLCKQDELTGKNRKKAKLDFKKVIIRLHYSVIKLANEDVDTALDYVFAWGWNEITEGIYQF